MIRVVLADDDPLVRTGLGLILSAQPDITIVGEASDGATAQTVARTQRPDVVLMDVRMPGTDGLTATRALLATESPWRVVMLTTFDLDEYVYAAMVVGASGFLLKDSSPERIVAAVRQVAAGDLMLAPAITRRLIARYTRGTDHARLASLTDRERDVLALIAQGLSNAEIAARLYLGEATVRTHAGRIFSKLGLRDRAQAVVIAYETGLATRSDPATPTQRHPTR